MDKKYNKTYKPLFVWLLGLIGFIVGSRMIIDLFVNEDQKLMTLIPLIMLVFSVYLLMFIIYKGEYVYWINGGPSYEEAKLAGSEKRKQYAKKYLDYFGKMTLICVFYSVLSLTIKIPHIIDILIVSLAIIITTILTMKIKF